MRGRKPRPLTVAAADAPIVHAVARCRHLPFFQVQHARIVLAVAAGEPIGSVASRLECDRATVWRVCRRYQQGGLKELLLDEPRPGRPQEISPPPARPDRRTRVSGADRRGLAHHALEQRGPRSPGGGRGHRGGHQRADRPAHPRRRGLAAAPHPLLEDGPPRRAVLAACGASPLVLCPCGTAGPPGHLGGGHR
jgi:hypothetical protein